MRAWEERLIKGGGEGLQLNSWGPGGSPLLYKWIPRFGGTDVSDFLGMADCAWKSLGMCTLHTERRPYLFRLGIAIKSPAQLFLLYFRRVLPLNNQPIIFTPFVNS